MMVILILVAFVTVATEAASVSNANMAEWRMYKTQYNKIYENEKEEEFRMQVYLNSSREVMEHNKLYAEGKVTYQIGINKFSDVLQEEFQKMMHMNYREDPFHDEILCEVQHFNASMKVSDKWDWREKGAVGPVKNQEQYGACWAFSAVGALEGHHYLKTNTFVSLSEQNLIDCIKHEGEGGDASWGFGCVIKEGGISSNEAYPYAAKNICHYKKEDSVEKIEGCRRVARNDEEQLKIAVEKVGPIAVSFFANITKYKPYTNGILYDEECLTATRTTHAVVLVGFGTENGQDYWLLKDSRGEDWGENGYVRIARNKGSHCLIASKATFPVG